MAHDQSTKPDWRQMFSPEEVEHILEYWVEPPKECTGKCDLVHGCVISCCNGCTWDDMGMPMT